MNLYGMTALGATFAALLMSSVANATVGSEQGPFHFEGNGTSDCGDPNRALYEATQLCGVRAAVAAATIGRPVYSVNPRYGEVSFSQNEPIGGARTCTISGNAYCRFDIE